MILFSRQKIGWLLLGVVCALPVSSSTELVHLWNRPFAHEVFARSYPDTAAAGAGAAHADLQRGIRRIMVYGLVRTMSPFSDMERHGFEILFGGCLVGGPGFEFWQGYNSGMVAEAKRLRVADIPLLLTSYVL